jgi:Tol biopolymer transport system component
VRQIRSKLVLLTNVPAWSPAARLVVGTLWVVGVAAVIVLVVHWPQRAYHAVVCNGNQEGAPSWSPDGTRLVFARVASCHTAFYIVHRDGTHVRRMRQSRGGDELPAWSPDGRTIAFTTGNSVDTMLVNGTHRALLVKERADFGVAWSPDSKEIAFATGSLPGMGSKLDSSISIMRSNGSAVRRVEMPTIQAGTPAWSPDGAQLAVAGGDGMYVIDLGSHRFIRVSRGYFGSNPVAPAWSPDGRYLSYVDGDGVEIIDVRAHLLHRVLTIHGATFGDGTSWSSTGEIAFSLSNGENRGIREVRPSGRDVTWIAAL